jgi:phosphate transport system permease protein
MAHTSDTPPTNGEFRSSLTARHRSARVWQVVFQVSTVVGIVVLAALLLNILNSAFGLGAIQNQTDPATLAPEGTDFEDLSSQQLAEILRENVSAGLYRNMEADGPLAEKSIGQLQDLVEEWVVKPQVIQTWALYDSLLHRSAVVAEARASHPEAEIRFLSWIDADFVQVGQSSDPEKAGVRTAILGSLLTILITITFAFPLGVGAAIYLEEYAGDNRFNRLIRTNINNLAGVPSIIYGLLGLAVFVRFFGQFTSGIAFGAADPSTANGRTIVSAGMTLGLLILPLVIINAREAIRAVPKAFREAALGLGATKWQSTWSHVLPNALPGILTGVILAVSRAFGETAPLIVVGVSTFIVIDPSGPFSKFTTLPVQIYQWTSRPQEEFQRLAAAAILVLLFLLLSLNATTIYLRNRLKRDY